MASSVKRTPRAARESDGLAIEAARANDATNASMPPLPRTGQGKINALPRQLKTELDRRLHEKAFSSYAELTKWLTSEGYYISRGALCQYNKRFDRQLAAVRMASEQARIVCDQFDGDAASMQEALMRLVQTEMFNLLVGINEHKVPLRSGKVRRTANATMTAVDLTSVARTVGGLVKTSIAHQQWVAQLKDKVAAEVAAAAKKIEAVKSDGLSEDAAAKIRDALLEIKV